MEERSLLIKKYIFPAIVILLGLILTNTALFSGTGSINQSGTFLLGAIVVLIMGIVTVLYIKEIIGKNTHLKILFTLLISCLILGYSTYNSISTTIAQIELKKEIDSNIKQGLRDIEIVQLEYKKKYGWYSDNFDELKRFLVQDSVYSISTMGVVPDYKITAEHAEILGYDAIIDYIQLESYDEKEALKCGLLTKDTSWENVYEKLFSSDSSNNRLYDFKVEDLDLVPMSNNKYFKMYAGILESSDDVTFEVINYKKESPYEFVSSYLIDFNGNDIDYYNKDIEGLIIKDSIPQLPQFELGDNIISVDSVTYNTPSDFLEALKKKKKDTMLFHIIRLNKELKIKLTQKDIVSRPSRAYWTDFEDVLSYNLQPPLYNPELFEPFYIGKDFITKADEFSSPSLKISNFKFMVKNRSMDSTNISFEIFKGDKINFTNYNEGSENYFYLLSKVGTPVFTAFDPSPYDPLNERDTLKTGSLKEVKTSGNWK
tara:strand:+ start:63 stop:1520 length:1458 start_codon:yes stop_codon:yes gene_type:complete